MTSVQSKFMISTNDNTKHCFFFFFVGIVVTVMDSISIKTFVLQHQLSINKIVNSLHVFGKKYIEIK